MNGVRPSTHAHVCEALERAGKIHGRPQCRLTSRTIGISMMLKKTSALSATFKYFNRRVCVLITEREKNDLNFDLNKSDLSAGLGFPVGAWR